MIKRASDDVSSRPNRCGRLSTGRRVDGGRSILATHGRSSRAIRANRQVAVLLIQERMKTLVIGRRQPKYTEQCAIASTRVLEASMNQRREIISRQFMRLEGLMYDRPEVLASEQPVPESIGSARAALETARCRH